MEEFGAFIGLHKGKIKEKEYQIGSS